MNAKTKHTKPKARIEAVDNPSHWAAYLGRKKVLDFYSTEEGSAFEKAKDWLKWEAPNPMTKPKNPIAVALGRLAKGVKKTPSPESTEQRREAAKKAIAARWKGHVKKP